MSITIGGNSKTPGRPSFVPPRVPSPDPRESDYARSLAINTRALVVPYFSGTTFSRNTVVSTNSAGKLIPATNLDFTQRGKVVGVSSGSSPAPDTRLSVVLSGEMIDPTWDWTPGPLYLGTGGYLLPEAPLLGFSQQIAVAVEPTRIIVAVELVQPLPAEGQVDRLTYHQNSALETWEINHNLGRYPSVTVVDSGGSVGYPDVQYLTASTILLSFGSATTGTAYLN